MGFFERAVAALPAAASSWPALIGYVAALVGFTAIALKVNRNRNLLSKINSLPEAQRAKVLQMEMGGSYLATGLSPSDWLQQQRQRYYFLAFLTLCGLALALMVASAVSAGSKAGPEPRLGEARVTTSSPCRLLGFRDFPYPLQSGIKIRIDGALYFVDVDADLNALGFVLKGYKHGARVEVSVLRVRTGPRGDSVTDVANASLTITDSAYYLLRRGAKNEPWPSGSLVIDVAEGGESSFGTYRLRAQMGEEACLNHKTGVTVLNDRADK